VAHPRYPAYPPRVIEFARRLHERGADVGRIRVALQKRGHCPSRNTVKRWVDPDFAEATRRGKRRGGRPGPHPRKTWRRRLERMQELRDLGVSYPSIAAVMSNDFEGVELDGRQVRSIFQGDVNEANIQRLLYPQGAAA
jgi:hypothetical protein